MKRVVISDIHIGSKFYKESELISFLNKIKYDQLILLGDIIDFIRVPEFTSRVNQIIDSIDFSKEIIYVVGNHDIPLKGFIGQKVFGIKFMSFYEFEEGGRKFRLEHGDRYDDYLGLIKNNFFMSILSVAQNFLENWFNFNISDWLTIWRMKRRKLRRLWDIIDLNSNVDVFICGHSHVPECIVWVTPDQKIKTYCNSGDWVSNSTYILIVDGKLRLLEWNENVKSEEY
jgi:UDP-2,3-diacylglucosamine pyrophosphatase LpxH